MLVGQVQVLLLPRPRPQQRPRHLRGGLRQAQRQDQAGVANSKFLNRQTGWN